MNAPEWHDVKDPNSPELDQLAERYHLHPLHIEDCRHRNQRAKLEEGNGYLFVVMKPVWREQDDSLEMGDLDLFLGPDYIITVREHCGEQVVKLLDSVHALNLARPDQIFYRVIDGVVDGYLPILDIYDDKIDDLQDKVLDDPTPAALSEIFDLKRGLIDLRRILVNTRDVTMHLQRTETELISRDLGVFFRDVYDHVARNLDLVETQRDLLTGALDVYLSSVANRTNQVMKVLTVMGTAALPTLAITGFYGMNLKWLPLLDHPHGVLIIVLFIIAATLVLLGLLRRFRWF